jgi:type IV pilus assembly protein PilM
MLFSRKSIGVDISPNGAAFALLGGTSAAPRLERVAQRPFAAGTLRASLREVNILEPHAFCDRLREAHTLLLYNGTRISVALPDAVGRILLMDVEGRFKNRAEALDIIRWKLKKSLPFDVADTHLDYQQLATRQSGEMALLVTLVSRTVIGQYEELISAAGLIPARIDLTALSLCRAFEKRLAVEGDGALISFHGSTLAIMVVMDGIPEFVRIKELPGAAAVDSRVYMEINNSLLAYRERFPERMPVKVACIAAPDANRDFCGMVAEATGIEPLLLEVKSVIKPSDAAPADQKVLYPFTVAIGAALRSL